MNFPKNFLWGTATASHQVEGGNVNNWTVWEKRNAEKLSKDSREYMEPTMPKKIYCEGVHDVENYISGDTVDQYRRYVEDFDIMKALAFNSYRFSIEWSRIFPKKGVVDYKEIEHYKNVISELKKRNIEPIVTVWHWTNPLWVEEEGAVLGRNFLKYYKEYVKILSDNFKDVKYWVTINEPEIVTTMSYYKGFWPPEKKGFFNLMGAFLKLMKCHRAAYKILKKDDNNRKISFAHHRVVFEYGDSTIPTFLSVKFYRFFGNFLPLFLAKGHLDYIGVNHYGRTKIKGWGMNIVNENKVVSDMGWEVLPRTIYSACMSLKKYNLPIMITENGQADEKDVLRGDYIKEVIDNLKKAMLEGVNIIGYMHWSFIDNFEWDKGFWPKFGLVGVDRKTMKRTVKKSAYVYSEIIRNHRA